VKGEGIEGSRDPPNREDKDSLKSVLLHYPGKLDGRGVLHEFSFRLRSRGLDRKGTGEIVVRRLALLL